jgi:hypothetical protein
MLKGTNEVVENKVICNHVPLIEVFMQNWFMKEKTTKQLPPSSSKDASGCTKKKFDNTCVVLIDHDFR